MKYSFTGKGTVLLRANTAGRYGSKTYAENEPIALMSEVDISVDFSSTNAIATKGTSNLMGSSKSAASFITVGSIPITDVLLSLVYNKQDNLTHKITIAGSAQSNNGVAYITHSEVPLEDSLFVYDENRVRAMPFYDVDNHALNGLPDGRYSYFYETEVAATEFDLKVKHRPYMSVEAKIQGNLNGKDGVLIFKAPSVNLITTPSIDTGSNNPFVQLLEFGILKEEARAIFYAN